MSTKGNMTFPLANGYGAHYCLPRAQRVITDALGYMMARAHDVKCRVLGQSPRDGNFELC